MQSLAKTLRAHATGILNWFDHRISSGKLEGINNNVGAMTRAAYGYRDQEFLHLKLYSLHESSLRLSGV
ncbi:MAG: transposase [Limisphaerales bacterium]